MVEAIEIEDRGAGTASESYRYRSDPPTSGRHHPETIAPGYYEDHQIESRLVNALEHGNIVIYYGEVDPTVRTNLRRWAVFYGANEWAGLVVVPKPQIGKSVILTAWGHKLTLGPFDPAASAAFVDKYRGRGPENRVR